MVKKDGRVDVYIQNAQPFAIPILKHLRKLVHQAIPDIEESIKWSFTAYDYKGPICHMATFKQHVAFGFWKASLLKDTNGYLLERAIDGGEGMGNLGRITCLEDLPPDEVLINFLHQAKKLNDENIKVPKKTKPQNTALEIPEYFSAELKKNPLAQKTFENFSLTNKREYVNWVTEAKTEKTRMDRLATSMEWMSEGKIRNWKYAKK